MREIESNQGIMNKTPLKAAKSFGQVHFKSHYMFCSIGFLENMRDFLYDNNIFIYSAIEKKTSLQGINKIQTQRVNSMGIRLCD